MTTASDLRSGKSHRDENFPVASRLIAPRYRAPILAFYNFVRTADDIADHASLSEGEKLAYLDRLERSLLGKDDDEPEGVALRKEIFERGLSRVHAQDLLTAFRLDVTKRRYFDWADLMNYCRYSAMPVGRFVLDVHGESRATWTANDALCAALQVINHVQDCAADYRDLDRVYVPLDALAAEGIDIDALAAPAASPALRRSIGGLVERTAGLLDVSRPFSAQIVDHRLACEVAAIQALAERLVARLRVRDPLSQKVHLSKAMMALTGLGAVTHTALARLFRSGAKARKALPNK
jgi:squalene synthase HpnC